MQAINELTIRGQAADMARLRDAFDAPLPGGWRRDREAEARWRSLGLRDPGTYCFAHDAADGRPPALVWLRARGEALSVDSIVGLAGYFPDAAGYNAVLADFHDNLVRPLCGGLSVEVSVTPYRVSIGAYLSHESVDRLEKFVAAETGAASDYYGRQRWRSFVISSHLDDSELDSDILARWLQERGWPAERARDFACEYADCRQTLAAYDEERRARCPC